MPNDAALNNFRAIQNVHMKAAGCIGLVILATVFETSTISNRIDDWLGLERGMIMCLPMIASFAISGVIYVVFGCFVDESPELFACTIGVTSFAMLFTVFTIMDDCEH
jgi:uncharacterized membrane protein